jgi:hypothetical protein
MRGRFVHSALPVAAPTAVPYTPQAGVHSGRQRSLADVADLRPPHLTATSATVLPQCRWPQWPAAPCCRRPGSAGQFHLVQEGPAPRGLPGDSVTRLVEPTRKVSNVPSTLGNKRRPRPASHARAVQPRDGNWGRMRSWLSYRSDASGQAAYLGPSPRDSAVELGFPTRVHESVPKTGSDIRAHLRFVTCGTEPAAPS